MSDDPFARIASGAPSIASGCNTPSGTLYGSLRNKKGPEKWIAETEARARHGSILDRTLGAVFLAAYLSDRKVFFVARGPRERFNLNSTQLSRGLDKLERLGVLVTVEAERGRYRRIRLLGGNPESD